MTLKQHLPLLIAVLLFLPVKHAEGIGDGSKLKVAQVRYGGSWDPRPMASLVLSQEVRFRTSIDVQLKRRVVDLKNNEIFELVNSTLSILKNTEDIISQKRGLIFESLDLNSNSSS